MKAMVFHRYGGPEELHLEEVARPVPKPDELLIRIAASSVNALDWHFMRGKPLLVRLQYGLLRPKNRILGYDLAGTVEAVGSDVTGFSPGDRIFGGTDLSLGAFAEYVCLPADGFLAVMPPKVSFEQAASVPAAASTVLIGLRERGGIQPGQKVLINGSSGGVGTFAVQMAKALGAEVTAVCSTGKADMVRRLGADHVIDYTKDDFAESGENYDLLLDNVGNRSVADMLKVIRPGGTCVVVGFTKMSLMLRQAITGPGAAKRRGITWSKPSSVEPSAEHARVLGDLLESGKIIPEIERTYPLERLPEAMRDIEGGHAAAKIVITVP